MDIGLADIEVVDGGPFFLGGIGQGGQFADRRFLDALGSCGYFHGSSWGVRKEIIILFSFPVNLKDKILYFISGPSIPPNPPLPRGVPKAGGSNLDIF